MRDNNECKVVLTPVDYIKAIEMGNNDMSPKEELSVEQGEEAADINTEAVKNEKATTTLLTEQEEEPSPIICEKGNGDGK